jgi:hypothetical protein
MRYFDPADKTQSVNAHIPAPKPENPEPAGSQEMEMSDPEWMKWFEGDDPDYELRTGICVNCAMPIVQWHHHLSASYTHTATGVFTCDERFWTKPQAEPL